MDRREGYSQLELLPALVLRKIVKLMSIDELKALRLTSRMMKNQVEINNSTLFTSWNLEKNIKCLSYDSCWNPENLMRFSEEVETVKVVRVFQQGKDIDNSIKVLLRMHPELEEIHLGLLIPDDQQSFNDMLKICGQAGNLLKSLTLNDDDGLKFELGQDDEIQLSLKRLEQTPIPHKIDDMILISCCNSVTKLRVMDIMILDVLKYRAKITLPFLKSFECLLCLKITEDQLTWILNMTRLKVLRLKHVDQRVTQILTKQPSWVFSDLEELELAHYKYQGSIHPVITPLLRRLGRSLKVLKTIGVNISDEDLAKVNLDNFPHLENVDLSLCPHLTGSKLHDFIRNTGARLKVLNLSLTEFTGENLHKICLNYSSKLEKLDLSRTRLADNGFPALIKVFGSSLKDLNVSNCTEISGEHIIEINLNSIRLEKLKMRSCHGLTDKGLTELVRKFGRTLKYLDLGYTKITGESFCSGLFDGCSKLRHVDVDNCSKLTKSARTFIDERFEKQSMGLKYYEGDSE